MVKPRICRKLWPAWLVALMALISSSVAAQESPVAISPLEQTMYNSGKIWVVIAVAGVILLGIFVYLVKIDRSVSQIENEMNHRLKKP